MNSTTDNRNLPMITVAVIAYRAAEYIEGTLDSIKAQTYPNIELIISDDVSPDNTVEVCKKWLEKNGDRFSLAKLITADKNGGVVVNCNRALTSTHGEWIKTIGSDDILFPDAIEKLYSFTQTHENVKALFGKQVYFYGPFSDNRFKKDECSLKLTAFRKKVTAKDQYTILTKRFFGCAAAFMMKTSLLRELGGFDERWPVEDHPLYIKIVKEGTKIYYVDEFVVYRRIHADSIMRDRESDNVVLSKIEVKNVSGGLGFLFENANWLWRRFYKLSQWLNYNIIKCGNDKRNWRCRYWRFIARWFDPYNYYVEYLSIKEKVLQFLSRIDNSITNEK